MAGNEDLFQGIQMLQSSLEGFQKNVERLKSQRAIQGANEQINMIRSSEASDYEKELQARQVFSNLAGTVPIDAIQGLAELNFPKQQPIQSTIQGFTDPNPQKQALTREYMGLQQRNELAQIDAKNEAIGLKKDSKIGEKILKQRDIFATKFAANEIDALNEAKNVEALGNINSYTALETLKSKLVKVGEGKSARVSDADVARISPNPSIKEGLIRNANKYLDGKYNPKDKAEIMMVFEALKNSAQRNLKLKVSKFSNRAEDLGISRNELERKLRSEHGIWGAKTPMDSPEVMRALESGYTYDQIEAALEKAGK